MTIKHSQLQLYRKFLTVRSVIAVAFIFGLLISGVLYRPQPVLAAPADDFVTTWKTDNPGESNASSVTIPVYDDPYGSGPEIYNYDIDWNNDGVWDDTGVSGLITHDYGSPGTYTIRIKGQYPRFYFGYPGAPKDRYKLLAVEQWGSTAWSSMESAFTEAVNLTRFPSEAPNLSRVTSVISMLSSATSFNEPLNHWDVSSVIFFDGMLNGTSFNQPVDGWDVSNAQSMSSMFAGNTTFNQPLNSWNMSKVSNIDDMFNSATAFNQPLDAWDTSSFTSLGNTFSDASSFNQPLNAWDTSAVTKLSGTFKGATSFNQPLNNWRTSNVSDFYNMFNGATSFDHSLAEWDVSKSMYFFNMLSNSGLSRANYDATLNAWGTQTLMNDAYFGAIGLKYCTAAALRQEMISTYNWIIDGDIKDCQPTVTVDSRDDITDNPVLQTRPTFTGFAEPGSAVTVTVRSDPVVCTTTADSQGNWSCTLPSNLPAGSHTVTVEVTDTLGVTSVLGPYSVTVAGRAITNETPLAPNSGISVSVDAKMIGIAAAASLLLVAGVSLRHNNVIKAMWLSFRQSS